MGHSATPPCCFTSERNSTGRIGLELLCGKVAIEVPKSVIRRQFYLMEEEMTSQQRPEATRPGKHQCSILVSLRNVRNWPLTFPPATCF